jgi:hypothetical protein
MRASVENTSCSGDTVLFTHFNAIRYLQQHFAERLIGLLSVLQALVDRRLLVDRFGEDLNTFLSREKLH